MNTPSAPASMYRPDEGVGLWEHRGKVAAVGVGHSPTARRWDGAAETSVGAISLIALRRAIADAGVAPDQIDGLILDPGTTTGAYWPPGKPVPREVLNAYNRTDDPLDGVAKLSAEWILKNMPELGNVKFTMYGPGCMSNAICAAAQAVGDGLTHTCLVLKSWHNYEGRYYQGGANAGDTLPGSAALRALWGTPACYGTALQFAEYCHKYGKNHDMMGPFIENSRNNGLKFPRRLLGGAPAGADHAGGLPSRALDRQARQPVRQRPADHGLRRLPVHHRRTRPGYGPETGLHSQPRVQPRQAA